MSSSVKRVVVVTGGSKGIGRAVALKFAEEQAKIIIVHYDPDEEAADETLNLLAQKGIEAISRKVDVSSFGKMEDFFNELLDKYKKIDVLVNNAGIIRDALLIRMDENAWDMVLNINLKSVYNCTKSVARTMLKQRSGCIVNIASVVGQIGNAGQANYSASKAGIMGFTKSVAREMASRGVIVNAVAPGFIDTEMTRGLPDKARNDLIKQIPMGKLGSPEDVAETVYWLCSNAANYITGQIIHVNGGMYM